MLFAQDVFKGLTPPYSIAIIDPPWAFASNSEARPARNARRHYPCLSISQIERLPISEIMDRDSLIYMWVTAPFAELAFRPLKAWGYSYKTQMVWVKQRIGLGYWARNRHEPIYIATRGDFPCPRPAPHRDSVITAPAREHSRKPPELADEIDARFPGHRKVEIFAREQRPGWDAWGNETDKFASATEAGSAGRAA